MSQKDPSRPCHGPNFKSTFKELVDLLRRRCRPNKRTQEAYIKRNLASFKEASIQARNSFDEGSKISLIPTKISSRRKKIEA